MIIKKKTDEDRKKYQREYMKKYRQEHKNPSKRVNVSLSKSEYFRLKKSAKEQKISPTKQLKNLAFIALDEQENYPVEIEKSLKELVHVLRGVGNNINQIARYSNTVKKAWNEDKALQHLIFLEQEIQKFLNQKT